MRSLEDTINASVQEIAGFADQAATRNPARQQTTPEPVQWLSRLSRQAAAHTDGCALAREAAAGLAEFLKLSHYALARSHANSPRLTVDLYHVGPQRRRCGPADIEISAADRDSVISLALQSRKLHCVDDLHASDIPDRHLVNANLASAAAVPLIGIDRAWGALLVGDRAPRRLNAGEKSMIEAAGNIVSAAIARVEAESQLAGKQSLAQALHKSLDALLIVMTADGRITEVNSAACSITGFRREELLTRSLWSALLVPEELNFVKDSFARLHQHASIERFESFLLTKAGERRRISWSVSRLGEGSSGKGTVVCTGIDITERCQAIERAERAEAAAASARRMFANLQQQIDQGQQQCNPATHAQRLPPGVEYDRRARSRCDYPYYQRIAPLHDDDDVPRPSSFQERKCHDISSRGFAFLTGQKPDYDRVVVAFGTPPTVVYLTADVRHATPKAGVSPAQFIVGCRYTGRVSRDRMC